jgi:uncharacterized peroxidase-related enzyme
MWVKYKELVMTQLALASEASLSDAFRRWPEHARRLYAYVEQVMRGPSPLSEGQRELLAAFVSRLNGCSSCETVHAKGAERFGVDAAAARALDLKEAPIDDRMRVMMRFTERLTRNPRTVGPAEAARVLDAGWDEDALFSAISVCAALSAINRIVAGLAVEPADRTDGQKQTHLGVRGGGKQA